MAEFKLVLSGKDGKSVQKVVKDQEAGFFLKKSLGDKVKGSDVGMEGYEFVITGGSDKCGFPMRKGILQTRQRVKVSGKGVGFFGKNRNKKTQKGLMKKKTVCGERIGNKIVQINLKVLKEGAAKLGAEEAPKEGEAPAETKEAPKEEAKAEAPEEKKAEEPKEEVKEEKPAEAPKEEEPKEIKKAEETSKEEEKNVEDKSPQSIEDKSLQGPNKVETSGEAETKEGEK